MDGRIEDLNNLASYIDEVDNDMTMILQTLQWDRKFILEHPKMSTCRYDSNHKVISSKLDEHEQECLLRHNGSTKNDLLLPDPFDVDVSTLIKLGKEDIAAIIKNASILDPSFKRGLGSGSLEPMSLDRLQCAYTSDERRAIHDAVVSAAPSCHDLADLALPSTSDSTEAPKTKSRMEILAELRDMRRRRTKYRVAAKSRNYSDVLRDVIATQMEHFNGLQGDLKPDVNELSTNVVKETKERDKHDRADNHKNSTEKVLSSYVNKDTGRLQGGERYDRSHRSDENSYQRPLEYKTSDCRDRHLDRERRHSRRDKQDCRHQERRREIKHEVMSDNDSTNDKYNVKHGKYDIKSRGSGGKHDKGDRESRYHRYRDDNRKRNRKSRKQSKSRSRDRYVERGEDLSDRERAQNLITEIKREIESVEREDTDKSRSDGTSYTESGQDKYHRNDRHPEHSHQQYRHCQKDKRMKYRDADNTHIDNKYQRNKIHNERRYSRERSYKHEEKY